MSNSNKLGKDIAPCKTLALMPKIVAFCEHNTQQCNNRQDLFTFISCMR